MKRLKKVAERKFDFMKFDEAKKAADQYAKEDGIDYAVIQPPVNQRQYEVIPDEGFDSPVDIPAIQYHTSESE